MKKQKDIYTLNPFCLKKCYDTLRTSLLSKLPPNSLFFTQNFFTQPSTRRSPFSNNKHEGKRVLCKQILLQNKDKNAYYWCISDAAYMLSDTTCKMKENSPLSLVGNSRHSYRVYGVYSYGNSCQTLRVTKFIYSFAWRKRK